jgi:hypothetical protein
VPLSGQEGAGLVEVLASARHLERWLWPSQAAASPALTQLLLVVRLVPCAPQAVVLLCCGATRPVCERLSPQSLAFISAGCLELICWKKQLAAAMPHQLQFYAVCSFSYPGMSLYFSLEFNGRSCFICGLEPSNLLPAAKVWTLSTWIEIRNTILDIFLFNIWSEKLCKITTQPSPSPIQFGVVLLIAHVKSNFCADGNFLMNLVQLLACLNPSSSSMLQVVFLHIQKGAAGLVLDFFTRSEATLHCLRWYSLVLENHELENHLHNHHDAHKLNKISICEYINLSLYQLYMKIFESGSWSIGHAARNLKYFSTNYLSCVNQWRKDNMIVTSMHYYYVRTQKSSIDGGPIGRNEQAYLICYCCTRSLLIDGTHSEDTIPLLFGLCHRRWTTAPSLLILRFNSGDPLSLSSVKAIQYLQLNAHKPQVHTPDRPLGESLAGHQLVWSTKEALEDCNCSKFEPELSSDKRPLFDSSCSLWYLLCKTLSSRISYVQLTTAGSCSFPSFVMLYCDR